MSMLKDRVAIITGASQGLGREIARTFLKAGASVTIIARESEPLEQTAGELRACLATGQDLLPLVGDVSKPDPIICEATLITPDVVQGTAV